MEPYEADELLCYEVRSMETGQVYWISAWEYLNTDLEEEVEFTSKTKSNV